MDLVMVGAEGMARAHARHFAAIDGVVLAGADVQKVLDLCIRSDESGSRFAI